jgi:fructan beta-fructosidase
MKRYLKVSFEFVCATTIGLLCPLGLMGQVTDLGQTQAPAHRSPAPELTPAEVADQQNYRQPLRPQFHYTALQGHIGDATGLVEYEGEYHLFNIFDEWGRRSSAHKRWGHAISSDLVHWTQMPAILDTEVDHGPGSGSGVVDWNNSSGLRSGPEKTLVVFYTDYKAGSSILFSNDRGRNWERYKGNPVLPGFEDIRDPNVFWYQPAHEWRMIRYEKQGFSFYRSTDLLHWAWLSKIDGFYECPDLFELRVANSSSETRWVLVNGDGSYVRGNFNGITFFPETPKLKAEYGPQFYAAQTWKHALGIQLPIQIGWLKYPHQSTLTWDGQMSFPVTLSLLRLPEGIRLIRQPVDSIYDLRIAQQTWRDINVENEKKIPELSGKLLDLNLTIAPGGASAFGLRVNGKDIFYSTTDRQLHVGEVSAPLSLQNGLLRLRVLIDRSSIEVFTYPGQVSISTVVLDPTDSVISLISRGGISNVQILEANTLESSWLAKDKRNY